MQQYKINTTTYKRYKYFFLFTMKSNKSENKKKSGKSFEKKVLSTPSKNHPPKGGIRYDKLSKGKFVIL